MAKMILLLLSVFVGSALARRTCFCDIRTTTSRSSPVFIDVTNPVYRGFLGVSCSRATQRCSGDCRWSATRALGGSVAPLDDVAGTNACRILGREVTPDNPVHLYAHYRTSSCGHEDSLYLGEVCCWEINFGPGYPIQYLHNPSCSADQHPLLG